MCCCYRCGHDGEKSLYVCAWRTEKQREKDRSMIDWSVSQSVRSYYPLSLLSELRTSYISPFFLSDWQRAGHINIWFQHKLTLPYLSIDRWTAGKLMRRQNILSKRRIQSLLLLTSSNNLLGLCELSFVVLLFECYRLDVPRACLLLVPLDLRNTVELFPDNVNVELGVLIDLRSTHARWEPIHHKRN